MGTNTLSTRSPGEVIPSSDHNSLVQALEVDMVPRNGSGVATDIAGSIGTSTYRWDSAYVKKIFIGEVANLIDFEQSGSTLILKLGGSTVATFTSNGIDDSSHAALSIARSKLAGGTITSTNASGSYSTTSTSYTGAVTNLSTSYSVVNGRKYFIGLTSDPAQPDSYLKMKEGGANPHALGYIRLKADSTVLNEARLEQETSAGSGNSITAPVGSLWSIYSAGSTGSVTFACEARVDATFTGTFSVVNAVLSIFEIGGV